jgi:glycerol-3-phosphate dehydrogenase
MERREVALDRLAAESFDLLVIGGGITGAGVALDAASRGMRVALLERSDYASGTSSRSTKLVHGGVRYLAQRDITLVREALAERQILLTLAPHLVQPQPFVLPIYRGQRVPGFMAPAVATRALTAAGLAAYDLLAGRRRLQGRRSLSSLGARGLVPSLRAEGLRGAFLYYDARTDDVRLVLAALGAAAAHGAAVANYVEVTGFEYQGGRIAGVQACDRLGQRALQVRTARVVSATGAWSQQVSALDGRPGRSLRLSKGVHLVIDRESLPLGPIAVVLPTTADGRLAFAVPWGNHVLIGTTDTPYEGDPAAVNPDPDDVDALLGDANRFLDLNLGRADIISAFAGLRPLIASDATSTATTSREHAVSVAPSGLVSVSGGKLTTYRRMARDAVDAALRAEPGPWGESCTERVPLQGSTDLARRRREVQQTAAKLDLSVPIVTHLLNTYGADARDITAIIAAEADLGRPIVAGLPYVRAEVPYAARHEGAQSLDDILRRRTRLALETRDAGAAAAADVADLLAAELGWDDARRSRELATYREQALEARAAWIEMT